MPTEYPNPLCSFITIDLRWSLDQLMTDAHVAWVSPEDKDAFLAHDWPTHHEERAVLSDRCFALITDSDLESTRILHTAFRCGRCVCPATLHEVLALAAFFRTSGKPHWTNHDFTVVGTRVNPGGNTWFPTVALREGALYLGAERFSSHDPPSHIMVTY